MKQISIALAALSGTAFVGWFGTGLHPAWWAMWIAPLPVLLASVRLSGGVAFAVACGAWALAGLNMWSYYRGPIAIPVAVAVVLVLLPALVFGSAVSLWRAFVRRGSAWKAALAAPALWGVYEFVMARLSPHSTFGSLGYTQMDCLPVLQVASLGGISAVAFLVLLFSSAVAAALTAHRRTGLQLGACAAGLFALACGWGWLRVTGTPDGPMVRVALGASDAREDRFAEPGNAVALAARYAAKIRPAVDSGARAVVIPEKLARVTDAEAAAVDTALRSVAHDGILVAGFERWTGGKRLNEARVYGPPGIVRASYDKQHMIPGFESDLAVGTELTVLREASGAWGVAICKDMDFPQLSRDYARDGVGLMLVPAWDFSVDGWLHSRMAVARGVESGFSIARSAKQGLLTVSDSRGRVLAEAASSSAPFALLSARAPVLHETTVYARFGDWLGWLNVALLAFLVASTRRKMSV